jgi:hypothetical protein
MDLSILEYLLTAGHPAECPPPAELAEPDDTFSAACDRCGQFTPCDHDLIEWAEEVSHV